MEIYDTFEKKSIEISNFTEFLKAYGLYNPKNRQTIIAFAKRTKHCLDRFVKKEFQGCIFKMYCLDNGQEYECVNFNGFLKQIKIERDKKILVELNKMQSRKSGRYRTRKTIHLDGLLYCLSENKDKISNHSLCSTNYQNLRRYSADKLRMQAQRKLANNLRSRIRHAVLKKSDSSINLLGCDIEFFMSWLEKKFVCGMNWENYGEWHVDHITPCISFDLTDPLQQKTCFNYSNCQPLWATDNFKKGSKIL